MDTEIKNAVRAADTAARYDDQAKRLLGNKIILAHILVKTVDEFLGMDPAEAVQYIEGEPFIGTVPVEPGMTNVPVGKNGQRLSGLNTENAEVNEGLVRFDIIFYVRMRDGVSQIIVNVEAQKDEPSGYGILNRAVFYVSRLVSSQKERDFAGMDYNDIKRVFSIWICMGMRENSMGHVHLAYDSLLGDFRFRGRLDLLNIVMVGLSDELPAHDDRHGLHRLLGTLLSAELSADEKLGIMETEYRIPADDRIRKDVGDMCNLGRGVFEKGEARGIVLGIKQGEAMGIVKGEARIIIGMHQKGYTVEEIAEVAGKSTEEVRAVIEQGKPLPV